MDAARREKKEHGTLAFPFQIYPALDADLVYSGMILHDIGKLKELDTGELGIASFVGTWRGLYAKKGTPQEAIDAMVAAVEKASQDPVWIEFLKNGAYDEREGFASGEKFKALMDSEYEVFTQYLKDEGILAS